MEESIKVDQEKALDRYEKKRATAQFQLSQYVFCSRIITNISIVIR